MTTRGFHSLNRHHFHYFRQVGMSSIPHMDTSGGQMRVEDQDAGQHTLAFSQIKLEPLPQMASGRIVEDDGDEKIA